MKKFIANGVLLMMAATTVVTAQTTVFFNDGSGNLYQYNSQTWTGSEIFQFAGSALQNSSVGSPYSISAGPLANTIYMTTSDGILTTFNTTTLQTSVIGGSGLYGNAFGEGRDGYLYMGNGSELYQVDPATGSYVAVGSGAYQYAGDIAVNPLNTALMYGAVIGDNADVWLATIDRATGAQTLIGDTGLDGEVNGIYGIGFDSAGDLFGAGAGEEVYQFSLSTGAATAVAELPFVPYDMATQPYTFNEPTPEPATLAFVGFGAAAVFVYRRRLAR